MFNKSNFDKCNPLEEYSDLKVEVAQEVACDFCPSFVTVVKKIWVGDSLFDGADGEKLAIIYSPNGDASYNVTREDENKYSYKHEIIVDYTGVIQTAELYSTDDVYARTHVASFQCN
jgi:hypothetical protein